MSVSAHAVQPAHRRRSLGRGVRSALLVAAMAVVGVAGAATAGQAAPTGAAGVDAIAQCPFTDTLCLFDQPGYGGSRFAVTSLVPTGTCVSLVEHGWGDRARSAFNTNATSAALFANDACLGDPFQVPGNSGVPDLGTFRPASVWIP